MIDELEFGAAQEHDLVRDAARRFFAADYAALAERGSAWKAMAELGWLACALPEDAGGFPGGTAMLAVIAEAAGRALNPEPLVPSGASAALLLAGTGGAMPAGLLERVIAGDERLALAYQDADQSAGERTPDMRAVIGGSGVTLAGRKVAVLGAAQADTLVVTAITPGDELAILCVPRDHPAVALDSYRTLDGRDAANVTFDDIKLDCDAMVSGPAVRAALDRALDAALVLSSAEMLGAMEAAFELTRTYLMTRHQFGQPIGTFQVLRHRLADMYIEIEQARSMVMAGVAALDQSPGHVRVAIAAAVKSRVAKAAHYVCGQAVQLHGGIGMTEEYSVGPIYRRAVVFDLLYGTGAEQAQRYATLRPKRDT